MNTARKSFLLSLVFHSLMGSLAFFILTRMHTPPPMVEIPLRHIMVLSVADHSPTQKHPEIMTPITEVVPPQPTLPAKTTAPLPLTQPTKSAPNAVAVPIISAPPIAQHTIQAAPAAEIAPPAPKPSIDTAAEMQSFKASLKTKIKQNLHYPPTARRRGVQGEVAVRFTLFSDGSIRDISVLQGEEIFHTAAKAAVASAEGIDIPKNLLTSLPKQMDLTLEFKLNS